MRFAVLESALARCPMAHVDCAVHDVLVDLDEAWYVFAAHATHALFLR